MMAVKTSHVVSLDVPSAYKAIFADSAKRVGVEIPQINTRMYDVAAIHAIGCVGFGEDHLILCHNPQKIRYRVEKTIRMLGDRPRTASKAGSYYIGDGALWISDPRNVKDLPLSSFSRVVLCQADAIRSGASLLELVVRGRFLAIGCLPDDEFHWFYQYCRHTDTSYHRVTVEHVRRQWTDVDEQMSVARERLDPSVYKRRVLFDEDAARDPYPFSRFCRERLIIRDKEGILRPLAMTPLQKKYVAHKRLARRQGRRLNFLVLKPRREGITTIEQALSYRLTATMSNQMAVTLAHTRESTERIFRIAHLYHERDPKAPQLAGVGNAKRLEFEGLNSSFFIGTAGAVGFGRGDTLQRVHGSEVAKWGTGSSRIEKVSDLVAGLTEAASHGTICLETTANGYEWFKQTWDKAKEEFKHSKDGWYPIFFPWFESPFNVISDGFFSEEEILDTLSDREKFLVNQHGLSLGQIAWRRAAVRRLGRLFPQEYPENDEECFLVSGTAYFDTDRLLSFVEHIEGGVTEMPLHTRVVPGGVVRVWEEYDPAQKYVAGSDTSEGLANGDLAGFVIMRLDGSVVVDGHGRLSINDQAGLGCEYCNKYHAFWGIERNNTSGGAVIAKVRHIGFPESRLFRLTRERFGWSTDSASRPVMLSSLRDWIDETPHALRDPDLVKECIAFKLQANGRYEADPGAHDDRVMKYAVANAMRDKRPRTPRITLLGNAGGSRDE